MANGKKKFWIGTLVGGVVGSVAALLLAPKSGRELRADIAEGAQQLNEKTQRLAKQIEEQKDNFLATAREKAAGLQQQWSQWRQADDEAELTVLDDTVDVAPEEPEKELEVTRR
ncbi:YtxH domain-containing protein [Paenibacillus thiaminolyticus]|uniref:YtxH domain-containing protein n=1 Tax=Paenibacillus thiaminolyticus TaxID=49283 RepID=UPI0011622F26|nr:YtxH domain-containing protein [Paenibacillus thiaminolyticus]MDG0874668.1 YtxH domain-containing protein [Paenibacillus thiaminolyticus]NGP57525.1 YtxH domain-containing protein [Paenibacillus thiaminolyticus]